MGVEFHITRRRHWASQDGPEISFDEWVRYVASDPELRIDHRSSPYCVLWSGPSAYDEPWLKWFEGNIDTKWPDTALYRKMLKVAAALGAHVQDDDSTVYAHDTDWSFDPNRPYGPT